MKALGPRCVGTSAGADKHAWLRCRSGLGRRSGFGGRAEGQAPARAPNPGHWALHPRHRATGSATGDSVTRAKAGPASSGEAFRAAAAVIVNGVPTLLDGVPSPYFLVFQRECRSLGQTFNQRLIPQSSRVIPH
jgi:hypothetical protein